jgi:predicted nucleotidyltransferase component of viral defense system
MNQEAQYVWDYALGTDFYLAGGTAVSRAYLHHCVSDDLDLFVKSDSRFAM